MHGLLRIIKDSWTFRGIIMDGSVKESWTFRG
jgi:hypothetical protein